MFDALLALSKGEPDPCEQCGDVPVFRLEFEPGLDRPKRRCEVIAAYKPDKIKRWKLKSGQDKDKWAEFFPFLVILKCKQYTYHWLPYWHRIKGSSRPRKYGQWAPLLRSPLLDSMLAQARADGHL